MNRKINPIKPQEVPDQQNSSIPDQVIEVFNDLIVKEFNGRYAFLRQDAIISALAAKGIQKNEIFKNKWLDVEDLFRKSGWNVEYDSPAYCESYEPSFKFSKK